MLPAAGMKQLVALAEHAKVVSPAARGSTRAPALLAALRKIADAVYPVTGAPPLLVGLAQVIVKPDVPETAAATAATFLGCVGGVGCVGVMRLSAESPTPFTATTLTE